MMLHCWLIGREKFGMLLQTIMIYNLKYINNHLSSQFCHSILIADIVTPPSNIQLHMIHNNNMFKRIRQNINNKVTGRQESRSPTPRSCKSPYRSYTEISKKKSNGSEVYDFQLAWICDHLYQGQYLNNQKHGEGIMVLNNGVTIIGSWHKGRLDGNCLFFTPFGGKIYCRFIRGKLEGWCFVFYLSNLQISRFQKDKRNPIRTRFDDSEKLWVKSEYETDGRLKSIIQIERGHLQQLPTFLNNLELTVLYDRVIVRNQDYFKQRPFHKIANMKIAEFQYYGYLNHDKSPEGLGILSSGYEMFAGKFNEGSLDKYGMILFENGLLYKGEINAGNVEGDGAIYDPNLDATKVINTQKQGSETIVGEQDGFDVTGIPFQIGKIIRSSKFDLSLGFEQGVEKLCEDASKYYYKCHSLHNSLNQSEIGFEQRGEQQQKSYDNERHHLNYLKQGSFLKLQPFPQHLHQEEQSQNEEQIQDIKSPKSIIGIPLKRAPQFTSLTHRKQPQMLYPHLKQFQISKIQKFAYKPYEKPGMIYLRQNNRNIQ